MKKIISKLKKERELDLKTYFKIVGRVVKTNWQIDKWNLIGRLFFSTIEVASTVLATYYGSLVVGEVVKSVSAGGATSNLYSYAIISALFLLVVNIAAGLQNLLDRIVFIKWDQWFTISFNEAKANLDTDFFEDRDNQKLLNKVNRKGGWALGDIGDQFVYTYYNLLKMALIVGAIFSAGPWMALVIALASIPRMYTELKRSKLEWGIWAVKGDAFHRHQKTVGLFYNEKNLIEIKLYGLKNRLLHGVAAKNIEEFGKAQAKASKSTLGIESFSHLVYEGTFLGLTIYLISKTVSGIISIANFTFYTGILNQFSSSMRNLSSIISRSGELVLYARDFYAIYDSKPQIETKSDSVKLNKDNIPLIEFKNVSFAYRSNLKEKILDNLNLTINPGEHIALVGENGAGKTTIIKLLLRLYDVTEGEILVNGVNIKDVDLDSYWRQIGVLFQDFNRYPFDIQTNIELGRVNKKPTKQELDRAVELADLKPILKKLPKGINTILDNSFEEGVEPSGGQWQRVALARAFYRNSNILILDEPTAAVDANAEYEIFNNIFAHYGNKTALIISHRFSTVKRAQRIVVLEKGKILEQGTHKELMKKSKLYAEMFNKQAEGYLN
ncbi:MAG: ABC transporter ATP-binding protein [Candidatus Nomurabacteria bacterium]|nr:MAG: ABC transporter ATP-binding protein [Candidatus Nomurabacteria bacterium]